MATTPSWTTTMLPGNFSELLGNLDGGSPPVLDRFCQPDNGTAPKLEDPALSNLKRNFRCIMVAISALGVAGNMLNLITLRSPSLRTVPFMFIRALALFDLISLAAILVHFGLDWLHLNADPVVFYEVWVQDVLINSFLVAGLYCAVLLTIERYLLIRRPFSTGHRLLSIESTVLIKIAGALVVAVLLHSPMALQNKAKCTRTEPRTGQCVGRWVKGNNVDLLCHYPVWSLFNYYKMGRECLRFFCVLLLIVLNARVARSLQHAKRNRRLLIKRASMPPEAQQSSQINHNNSLSSPPTAGGDNKSSKRELTLMRSFTEKKLTALMVAICVIFAFGNIPQMVVMVVQNESVEHTYNFQVFRHLANTAEVLNHCLNFFIFCMASSEYCRAFLSLSGVRWLLRHCPLCASLARARLNGRLEHNPGVAGCPTQLPSNQSALSNSCPSQVPPRPLRGSENGTLVAVAAQPQQLRPQPRPASFSASTRASTELSRNQRRRTTTSMGNGSGGGGATTTELWRSANRTSTTSTMAAGDEFL